MPMTAKGLAKLSEECGELVQVIGKKLAYYHTDEHPDGGPSLSQRMEDEIGDVMAACSFVSEKHNLNIERIEKRFGIKRALFEKWHAELDNNRDGIDR